MGCISSKTKEAEDDLVSLEFMFGTPESTPKREDENGKREQPQSHVFKLLPEIWDGILPYLSATNFLAIINSSSNWRAMFNSRIAAELLPLVLPVLINSHGYGVTPASLLIWRAVSRQSKARIDQLLDEALSPQRYYEDLTTQHFEWSPIVMDAGYSLRRVIAEIRKSHTASNQQRLVELVTRSNTSFLPILDLTVDLLNERVLQHFTQHGHNLTELTLLRAFQSEFFYLLLSHIPNLKALKASGGMIMFPDFDDGPVVQPLNKLTLLDIESLRLDSFGLAPSILRICGSNLKRLICSNEFLSGNENVRLLTSEYFPSLTCLRVGLHLEQLQLYFNPSPTENYGPEFSALSILWRVTRFFKTLTHLQLFIRVGEWDTIFRFGGCINMTDYIQNHENLRKLSTWLPNVSQNGFWTFVCDKFQNLEELRLHTENWDEEEIHVDQLRMGFGLLSKLQRIVVFCGFHQGAGVAGAQLQLVKMTEKVVIRRDVGTIQRVKYSVAPHIPEEEDE